MKTGFLIVLLVGASLTSCLPDTPFTNGSAKLGFLSDQPLPEFPVPLFLTDIPHWPWPIRYTLAQETDSADLTVYLNLLAEEFDQYPPELIDQVGLRGLGVVKDLTFSGQPRATVVDLMYRVLLFDFARASYNRTYQRHVIHHEFYHLIEQQLNGSAYWKDPDWSALNEPGFAYGAGGLSAQNNANAYALTHPRPGFINAYSMSGLEEDKAEIFAILFVPEEYARVIEWAQTDPVLARKIDYMKNFLRRWFPQWNPLPPDRRDLAQRHSLPPRVEKRGMAARACRPCPAKHPSSSSHNHIGVYFSSRNNPCGRPSCVFTPEMIRSGTNVPFRAAIWL